MDNIIEMVVSIDRKASDIREQTNEHLVIKAKELKDEIHAMELEIMNKAETKAKSLYETIVNEAEIQAQTIYQKTQTDCEEIERKFIEIKDSMENNIFLQIINDRKV